MKIPQSNIDYIQNVVKTVQTVGMDKVAIESGVVRGVTDDKTVFILQTENVPTFEFGSIGISKLPVFQNRLNIVREQSNFSVEASSIKNTSEGSYVHTLTMRAAGIKVDFTCCNPKILMGVREFRDQMKVEIDLDPEIVKVLQRGINAMGGKMITIVNNEKETFFEVLDDSNDVFKYTLPTKCIPLIENVDPSFVFRYPADVILSLFKQNPEGSFRVGNRGILNVAVNNLNMYVMQRV